ncbi:nitroreductase [Paenibacillus sp. MBLB4367]|uniref:nitroreductase family protein n=1 Tax=Paenibacillus sp. MBLB4367 TaxID=3384767 RepID=UPI003907E82E
MTIALTIRERRSIHTFRKDPVPRELITELLNDAVWAPNHGLREPWRFIYADGEGKGRLVDGLFELYEKNGELNGMAPEQKEKFKRSTLDVPAYLLVVMKEDPRPDIWEEDFAAVACLIQNFQLLGWEKGLGMLWNTGSLLYMPPFRRMAGVEPGEKIAGILSIGYFDKAPKARPRTPAEERLTFL